MTADGRKGPLTEPVSLSELVTNSNRIAAVVRRRSLERAAKRAGWRELIDRLEKATGPDKGLDLSLATNFGTVVREPLTNEALTGSGTAGRSYPTYTFSIDAALSLVEKMLPGWEWQVGNYMGEVGQAVLRAPSDDDHAGLTFAATPPLALCLALLRALEARSLNEEAA